MANSSCCIYGPTGCFKTTQIKSFARYIAKSTGKATKLASIDGGGWAPCQPEIDAGMIDAWRIDTAFAPMTILRALSQGYWPENPKESDYTAMNFLPIDWSLFGGYAVEGWTSISDAFMGYLPDHGINVGGETRAKLGGYVQPIRISGELVNQSWLSNTRGDYREVQKDLHGLVRQFNSLPVRTVLYTALEAKGEDEDRRATYGPAIAGQKATGQCGPWVGDLIHAAEYQVVRTSKAPDPQDSSKQIDVMVSDTVVRYYYKRHLDPVTSLPFPAKPRVAPEKYAEMEKRFPGGYFEPKLDLSDSLGTYLEFVDKLAGEASMDKSLEEWRAKMDQKIGRAGATA